MTISNIILRALKKVIRVLEKGQLDWCLFGGLAMQVYKRIRATKDVDLMVEIFPYNTSNLIVCIEKAGFKFDRKRGKIKINGFELFRFIYTDEETNFEIFIDLVTAATDYQRRILLRKKQTDFFGMKINIASVEDIILLKVLADRPIDLVDAQVLLEENKEDIDKNYLRSWAKRLGLQRKLQRLSKRTLHA